MRLARVLALGWLFHLKMLVRDPFNGLLGVAVSALLRDVAFFMFQAGGDPRCSCTHPSARR